MSTPENTIIYLISGTNRGVGLGFVTSILTKHDNTFVYAGTRDIEGAVGLKDLAVKYTGRIAIVKCTSADVDENAALVRDIEQRHGRVDTVIANAAIAENVGTAIETPLSNMEDHFRINVFGPLVLFQATYALLKKSSSPRFVTVTSQAGSMDGFLVKHKEAGQLAYGSSKAALNWVTRKIHFENEWLVAFPISPGMVNTDMFQKNVASDKTGVFSRIIHLAMQPESASAAMLEIIDNSTREKHGGEFFNVDGQKAEW